MHAIRHLVLSATILLACAAGHAATPLAVPAGGVITIQSTGATVK